MPTECVTGEPDYVGIIGRRQREVKRAWAASETIEMGNRDRKLVLQAVFNDPGIYTAQFSVESKNLDPDITPGLNTMALVQWAVGGTTIKRLITVTNGTSITGAGQGVNVRVFDFSTVSALSTLQEREYLVACNVVPGGRAAGRIQPVVVGNNWQNGVTDPPLFPGAFYPGNAITFSIAPAGTEIANIPQESGINAMMLSAYPLNANELLGNDITFRFRANGSTFGSLGAASINEWIPVPPGAREVVVTNNAAVNVVTATYFGVEG